MNNLGISLTEQEIEVNDFCVIITKVRLAVQAMIDEADIDGDGQINYEEFYLMMKNDWCQYSIFTFYIFYNKGLMSIHFYSRVQMYFLKKG